MSLDFDHTIYPNAGNERPSRVIFADVESNLTKDANGISIFTPFLWTIIAKHYRNPRSKSTVTNYIGSDIPKFWGIVDSYVYKRTKTYLVTHHLEVDFMPMQGFKYLAELGYQLDKLIAHGRVLLLYWKKGNSTLLVMNNGNLFDGSIEEWGKVLDLPKLSMPPSEGTKAEWDRYCLRDTEIMVRMWDYLLDFMDTHNLGDFKVTKASLALAAYRHRFMIPKPAIHKHPKTIQLEREGYKGGRFEAMQLGTYNQDTYYSLDVTSMYGSIMAESPLPYELRGYLVEADTRILERKLSKYAVIAEVELSTPESFIPHVVDKKLSFAKGDFTAILSTPELSYCLTKGYIKTVHRLCWYYQAKILSAYAQYFLELKASFEAAHNLPMRQFTKLYLNSLYGKFAQHGYEDKIIGTCDPSLFYFSTEYDIDTHTRYDLAYYGGNIHRTEIIANAKHSLVAIASHITAYGRLRLYELIKAAGVDNVYHVATDSLLVNSQGYQNLTPYIQSNTPGMLKLEKEYKTITIKDVNDVILDGTIKIKGIPKKAVQLTDNSWVITEWVRMRTLLKHNQPYTYYTREKVKVLARPRYFAKLGTLNPDIEARKSAKHPKLKIEPA